jgi:hypothetical protein
MTLRADTGRISETLFDRPQISKIAKSISLRGKRLPTGSTPLIFVRLLLEVQAGRSPAAMGCEGEWHRQMGHVRISHPAGHTGAEQSHDA